MKQGLFILIIGWLCAATFAQDIVSDETTLLAKATDRRLDLHSHAHATPDGKALRNDSGWSRLNALEYGALFEVEVGHSDGKTDATMATLELGAGLQITDWLHGDLVFLYEENATDPMELDQLYLTLGNPEQFPLTLQAGQFYTAFGHVDTFFISDPIVLDLAEGREQGAMVVFERGGFQAGLTVFESEIVGAANYNGIATAMYSFGNEESTIEVGAALIRNILDADSLTGILEDQGYAFAEESAGANLWLTAVRGKTTLIVEYVRVLETLEIDGIHTGRQPSSLNLELGYALTDFFDVGAKIEQSNDAATWFAETRYGVVGNFTVFENDLTVAGISAEYLHEEFEDGTEDNLFTLQFALEF